MQVLLLLILLLAAVAYASYFSYKLVFWYDDPLISPYRYPDTDQRRAVKPALDPAIAEILETPYEEVSILSHDGLKLLARYYHFSDGGPLEIQCHGYRGNPIVDFAGTWQIAKATGRNILLIHPRCHGGSEGHPITFGIREQKDVLGWIRYAVARFGNIPILLNGVSMGAATVLMASAGELPLNVKGVIADCPYDTPSNIIKKVVTHNRNLPVKVLYPLIYLGSILYGKFHLNADSPQKAVPNVRIPILLIHGDQDRFVPHAMSQNLQAAAPENIEFHTISGAGHAINCITDPEHYARIVNAFTERYL